MDLLSDDVLEQSLQRFLGQKDPATRHRIGEKLAWWLCYGWSIERWLQFEYAHCLAVELGTEFVVGCERKYVDIVVHHRAHGAMPIWRSDPLAGIELKVRSNWFLGKTTFTGIQADINKINDRSKVKWPAIALVVWFEVAPRHDATDYAWARKQITKNSAFAPIEIDPSDLVNRMRLNNLSMNAIGEGQTLTIEGFDSFSVRLFGSRNGLYAPGEKN